MKKLRIQLPGFDTKNQTVTSLPYLDPYHLRTFFSDDYLKTWLKMHQDLQALWDEYYEIEGKRNEYRQAVASCRTKLAKTPKTDKIKYAQAQLTCEATESKLMKSDDGYKQQQKNLRIRIGNIERQIEENHALKQFSTIVRWLEDIIPYAQSWLVKSEEVVSFFEKRAEGKRPKVPAFVTERIAEGKKARPMKHKPIKESIGGETFEIITAPNIE